MQEDDEREEKQIALFILQSNTGRSTSLASCALRTEVAI